MASTAHIDQIITSSDNNLTALNTILAPQWVSAPLLRGTSSIIWSCVTTLIACVYTALHLNVPRDTSTWAMLKLKGQWVTIALLAPEVVVYMATSQLLAAWELKRKLHELFGDDCGIDMEYCFFVVMGGVELKTFHPGSPNSRDQRAFLSVSPELMLWLAERGHRMPIEGKRIQDKSKADLLQKCLVSFQATWMAVQCITRRALGLPLTILEVHTMVHVLCAAVMYAFWLKKPKDVREPERLYPDGMEGLAAVLSERAFRTLGDHADLYVIPKRVDQSESVAPEIILPLRNELEFICEQAPNTLEQIIQEMKSWRPCPVKFRNHSRTDSVNKDNGTNPRGEPRRVEFRWNVSNFGPTGYLESGEALPCGLANAGHRLLLSPELLAYWERVLEGLGTRRSGANWLYSDIDATVPEFSLVDDSNFRFPFTDLLLLDHFPMNREIRHRQFYIAMMLPAIYGGIHLAITSFEFPSAIESQLWVSSGLYVTMGLPVWEIMAWMMVLYESTGVTDTLLRCLCGADTIRWHRSLWKFIRSVTGRIFLLGYTLARLYIIVESFISLRHVPIGVYLTPSWIQMVPHI